MDEKLREYIKEQLSQGYSPDAVKTRCLESGWNKDMVDQILSEVADQQGEQPVISRTDVAPKSKKSLLIKKMILVLGFVLVILAATGGGWIFIKSAIMNSESPDNQAISDSESQGSEPVDSLDKEAEKDFSGLTNVPAIPGSNILFIVIDEQGNLVTTPTVKISVMYENSYYDYDFKRVLTENPGLQYMPESPEPNTVFKFSVTKYGYEVTNMEGVTNADYWDKYNQLGGKGIISEVINNLSISDEVRDKALELASEAVLLRVVTLSPTDKGLESLEQLKYSDQGLLLLYLVDGDSEKDFIQSQWDYLTNKYPSIKTFKLTKKEADEIVGKEETESVIILYRRSFHPADPSSYLYYGNETNVDAMYGHRIFVSDEWFKVFEENWVYNLGIPDAAEWKVFETEQFNKASKPEYNFSVKQPKYWRAEISDKDPFYVSFKPMDYQLDRQRLVDDGEDVVIKGGRLDVYVYKGQQFSDLQDWFSKYEIPERFKLSQGPDMVVINFESQNSGVTNSQGIEFELVRTDGTTEIMHAKAVAVNDTVYLFSTVYVDQPEDYLSKLDKVTASLVLD